MSCLAVGPRVQGRSARSAVLSPSRSTALHPHQHRLRVRAHLVEDCYSKDVEISDQQMQEIDLDRHPDLNYSIRPTYR